MLCFKLHVSVALTWNVTVAKTTQGCVVENQQAVPHQHIFFLVFFTLYKTAEADASRKMSTLSQRFAWLDFDIGKLFFNIITRLEVQQTIAHTSTCTLASCGDCIMRLWAQVLCACLFSAVNRSHEVIGAWLWESVGQRVIQTMWVCIYVCVCAVIHHCIPLSTNRSMATLKLWEPSERRCSSEVFRHPLVHTQIS